MSTSENTIRSLRRYAFYAAVVLAVGVPVSMIGSMLPWAVTGWTGFLGTHSVHDLVIFAGVWMGLFGLLAQFYRASDRVNAVLAMPFIMLASALIGLAVGSPFVVMGTLFGGLSLLALVLHPAGRSLFRFDRVASPDRLAVGLFAVGAVAMVAYGGLELVKQFTLADDHAAIQHYGHLALAAFYVALMAGLGVFRVRDWRFATWSAALVAVYVGASSAVFPTVASSLGLVGGLLLVVWAVVFVATNERARARSGIVAAPEPAEPEAIPTRAN